MGGFHTLRPIFAAAMSILAAQTVPEMRALMPVEIAPVRARPARRIYSGTAQPHLRAKKKARWHRPRKSNMVRLSRLVRRRHRRARRGR